MLLVYVGPCVTCEPLAITEPLSLLSLLFLATTTTTATTNWVILPLHRFEELPSQNRRRRERKITDLNGHPNGDLGQSYPDLNLKNLSTLDRADVTVGRVTHTNQTLVSSPY